MKDSSSFQQRAFSSLMLAASMAFGCMVSASASDLSLPRFSKDSQLATFHSQPLTGVAQRMSIDDDPITEVLSINEIEVWDRIRQGFGIPDLDNPLVDSQMRWYMKRPEYIERTTKRASPYLFHIVQELEKRGMPTELALLPFIESSFNPHARSTAKAEGLWQFIPSTGRSYDLRQSIFKDERRSILSSTDAALTYLQRLYGMFGDWQLALAAYNWGEGSVMRAIKRNQAAGKGTDFNSLSVRMPAETRNYVPKLLAVKQIIANADRLGVALPKIDNQPYFVTISKTRDIDVQVASKLAELPLDEFRALNPQFGTHVITGGARTKLLLPKANAERFMANLAQWKQPLSSWTAHQVTDQRETVESIAAKYNTTPDVIRHANHIPPNMVVKFGSTVLVPKTASRQEGDIAPELANHGKLVYERKGPETKTVMVRVRPSDNISKIAKRYRVSVAQIKSWNDLNGNALPPGVNLKIQVAHKKSVQSSDRASSKSRKSVKLASSKKSSSSKTGKTAKSRGNSASKSTRVAKSKQSAQKPVAARKSSRTKSSGKKV